MTGWKCPGCGKCFSPNVTECTTCGKNIPEITPWKPYRTDPWPFIPYNSYPTIWYRTTITPGDTIF